MRCATRRERHIWGVKVGDAQVGRHRKGRGAGTAAVGLAQL